jgi:hypothetical protein
MRVKESTTLRCFILWCPTSSVMMSPNTSHAAPLNFVNCICSIEEVVGHLSEIHVGVGDVVRIGQVKGGIRRSCRAKRGNAIAEIAISGARLHGDRRHLAHRRSHPDLQDRLGPLLGHPPEVQSHRRVRWARRRVARQNRDHPRRAYQGGCRRGH